MEFIMMPSRQIFLRPFRYEKQNRQKYHSVSDDARFHRSVYSQKLVESIAGIAGNEVIYLSDLRML